MSLRLFSLIKKEKKSVKIAKNDLKWVQIKFKKLILSSFLMLGIILMWFFILYLSIYNKKLEYNEKHHRKSIYILISL